MIKYVFNYLIVYLMADNTGFNVASILLTKQLKPSQPLKAVYISRLEWENQGGE